MQNTQEEEHRGQEGVQGCDQECEAVWELDCAHGARGSAIIGCCPREEGGGGVIETRTRKIVRRQIMLRKLFDQNCSRDSRSGSLSEVLMHVERHQTIRKMFLVSSARGSRWDRSGQTHGDNKITAIFFSMTALMDSPVPDDSNKSILCKASYSRAGCCHYDLVIRDGWG